MSPVQEKEAKIPPGAIHLPGWLDADGQARVLGAIRRLGDGDAGFYTPVLRTGARMRIRLLCCGMHWDAKTYRYQETRTDVDDLRVPPIPAVLADLAVAAARHAGFAMTPDVMLVNWYGAEGRLGLHQDRDESAETIAAGVPIVSLSIGDDALFQFGGPGRRDPAARIWLRSGDAFVFGGPARLNYHGVARIVPGSGPSELGLRGRYNMTFRQM